MEFGVGAAPFSSQLRSEILAVARRDPLLCFQSARDGG